MIWESTYTDLGHINFPKPQGVRMLMMPIQLEDVVSTLPQEQWQPTVQQLVELAPVSQGVAYLTIDEGVVEPGLMQRRPGLHVDGWHNDGTGEANGGVWGGGGGGLWGRKGMLLAANMYGCNIYAQEFDGEPAEFGDCEHLRHQLHTLKECQPNYVYGCGPMTVHESRPSRQAGVRQFVRLSMPSDCAWPDSCTPNPVGVLPTGPVVKARPVKFT